MELKAAIVALPALNENGEYVKPGDNCKLDDRLDFLKYQVKLYLQFLSRETFDNIVKDFPDWHGR
jgi:hypothetical protein